MMPPARLDCPLSLETAHMGNPGLMPTPEPKVGRIAAPRRGAIIPTLNHELTGSPQPISLMIDMGVTVSLANQVDYPSEGVYCPPDSAVFLDPAWPQGGSL